MCTLEKAQEAYDFGDYKLAYSLFLPLAKAGDAVAQSSVGGMLYLGNGVAKDEKEAIYWLEIAAESGNLVAQNNLGMLLIDYDLEKAIIWLIKAANRGSIFCQSTLGDIYSGCYNFPEEVQSKYNDISQAKQWYSRASRNGLASAEHRLGEICLSDQVNDLDISKAITHFEKAAEMGYEPSLKLLVKVYEGELLEVAADEEKAAFWRQCLQELEN